LPRARRKDFDRATLLALAGVVDVVVSNIRPQALARLGLDHAALSVANPGLIFCTAVGYGSDGPHAGKAVYDDLMQAAENGHTGTVIELVRKGMAVDSVDKAGNTFGSAWEGGAMLMGISRLDLIKKYGLKPPTTFEELGKVAEAMHGKDDMAGFVSSNLHHWYLPPYMQGFGGDVFANPPGDITPTLATSAAVEAVDFYARLLSKYSPQGVLSYTEDQARAALIGGRANINIHSSSWVTSMLTAPESKVKETALVMRMPAGPKGDFPASNSQGLGIPKNAKNKEAAWEFIKWALSPEITTRIVKDTGHSSICRRAVITGADHKRVNTINGQDLSKLYLEVLEQPGKTRNYMAYRTVKEFPVVSDVLNKAVERVVSGQMKAADSMKVAQDAAMEALRRTGARV
jgi:multiple sugar transport system substrate-binding protein